MKLFLEQKFNGNWKFLQTHTFFFLRAEVKLFVEWAGLPGLFGVHLFHMCNTNIRTSQQTEAVPGDVRTCESEQRRVDMLQFY